MPYIPNIAKRNEIDRYINPLYGTFETKGELEYAAFKLFKAYMSQKQHRYSTLHDAIYALEHAAHEARRRFLDAREDEAIKTNGDIK